MLFLYWISQYRRFEIDSEGKIEMEKLNIAMIGHKHIPSREGGIEVVVEELSTRMVKLGHSVTCFNRKGQHVSGGKIKKLKEYKGVKIKEVFTIERKGLAAMTSSFFATICASLSSYDVIHFHAEGPAFFSFIPRLFRKTVVVTIHGLDWDRAKWSGFARWFIKQGEKNAVKYADEIIVLSHGVRDYFLTKYSRETKFIPNGVNKPEIRDANEIKRWGLEKDNYILYLGRIVPEKGEHYLVEAWKKIESDKKLVIAGGVSDTADYEKKLKELAAGDERIIFTGFVQGRVLEELYSNAYIYCLPSDLEGMPLSLLEAMSYENCCLVSDIDECVEVVEDKGVTFQRGNVEGLREKLEWLLDNKEVVKRYKIEANAFIIDKYNWDNVVVETLNLYSKKEAN